MNRRQFLTSALAAAATGCAARSERRATAAQGVTRLGASTACFAGFSLAEAIAHLKRLGFGTIEMITYTGARHSVGDIPGFSFATSSPREREAVFAATRGFSHITGHLPFQGFSLFSSDARSRETGLEQIRSALDGLAYLKGELGVMHIGSPGAGRRFRDIWQPMIDTLRMLGDYAAERRLKIGVETMQPDSVREYADLIAETRHPAVGATIDTGHIRGSSDIGLPPERRNTAEARARFNDVLDTLVSTVAGNLLHFHISDVRHADWVDHKSIGSGIIDFPRLFATVRRIGYRNLFVLELEEPNQLEAVERSKKYVEARLAER
jgi:sugar phosphate isomerase/epimerase